MLSATEQALLTAGLRKGRLITFDEMHPSMAKLPSQEAAALAYAEVYTLVGWMQSKVGYKGIRDALVAQRDGKSARRAVAEAMDLPWPRSRRSGTRTSRSAMARRAPASRSSSARAAPTRRTSGSRRSVARARKHARLGGMLRARGVLEAAAVEYEKALAGRRPGAVRRRQARAHARRARPVRPRDRARDAARGADDHDAVAAVTLGMARAGEARMAGGDHRVRTSACA